MALPLLPPPGPGGGVVAAMQSMNALNKSNLENQFYAPRMQADIANKNALTQGQNIENQYMPDKLRLANALAQQQNQYYAPNIQSEMNYRNALASAVPSDIAYKQAQTQGIPSEIALRQAQTGYYNMGGPGMGAGQKELIGLQRQIQLENPTFTPAQANEAAGVYLNGGMQLSDGTQLKPQSGVVQSMVDQSIKRGTTAQGLNQQRSAGILDNLMNQGDKLMPGASKFAGLAGKANQSADAFGASLGANDPDYQDFQIFTQQIVPQLTNQMLITEGGRATDAQKKMMIRVANPMFWNSNPKLALKEWNYLTDTFRQSVTPTVAKSTGQIRAGLRQGAGVDNSSKRLVYNQNTGRLEPK